MFRPWLEFGLIQSALYSKHIQVMASAVANSGFQLQPNYVNAALARDQRFSEMFPTAVRYTGSSMTFNFAGILGASLAPYLATTLATKFGLASVGWYLTLAASITLVALVLSRPVHDSAFEH